MKGEYREMPDAMLVSLAAEGDQTACRVIYEKYVKAVRSRVSAYFQWQADVDDVVSETFQKFFSRIEMFDREREILPWLCTIAGRTALDHIDAIKRENVKMEQYKIKHTDPSEDGSDLITDVNPEDEIISVEDHDRLMEYIDELSSLYKDVMIKYMIEELEYEEISRDLGLPLNTVRTRIRRGKEKLSEMMLRGEIQ